VTGGTKTGVMEIVGEAAREHMLKNGRAQQNIVLLGVVDWNMVANNRCLISSEHQKVSSFLFHNELSGL
jgi:SLOG in TRPM